VWRPSLNGDRSGRVARHHCKLQLQQVCGDRARSIGAAIFPLHISGVLGATPRVELWLCTIHNPFTWPASSGLLLVTQGTRTS